MVANAVLENVFGTIVSRAPSLAALVESCS